MEVGDKFVIKFENQVHELVIDRANGREYPYYMHDLHNYTNNDLLLYMYGDKHSYNLKASQAYNMPIETVRRLDGNWPWAKSINDLINFLNMIFNDVKSLNKNVSLISSPSYFTISEMVDCWDD